MHTIVYYNCRVAAAFLVAIRGRRLIAFKGWIDSMPYLRRWFGDPFAIRRIESNVMLHVAAVGDCHVQDCWVYTMIGFRS